jgi:hypothetical protein
MRPVRLPWHHRAVGGEVEDEGEPPHRVYRKVSSARYKTGTGFGGLFWLPLALVFALVGLSTSGASRDVFWSLAILLGVWLSSSSLCPCPAMAAVVGPQTQRISPTETRLVVESGPGQRPYRCRIGRRSGIRVERC